MGPWEMVYKLTSEMDALRAECDALKAHLAEVEVQAATMRNAIESAGIVAYIDSLASLRDESPVLFSLFESRPFSVSARALRRLKAALSSPAGRETAERLQLLEELADAATAFVEGCDVVFAECCTRTCYEASECRGDRLRAAVKALKGGDTDAGTKA